MGVFPSFFTLVFETGSLTKHGAFSESRALYVGQTVWSENPPGTAYLCLPSAGVAGAHCHIQLLCGYWGSKFRSSCL